MILPCNTLLITSSHLLSHSRGYLIYNPRPMDSRINTQTSSLDENWRKYTRYANLYSPRNGLIAAIGTNRVPSEPIHWSDASFAMWQAISALARTDIRNLRHIARAYINNRETISIIGRAVPQQFRCVRAFKPSDEAFMALLGTPNGMGGVYLLMQHKPSLGYKTIARAVVIRDGPGDRSRPHLVFEVRDMLPPWHDGKAISTNLSIAPHLYPLTNTSMSAAPFEDE